MSEINHILKPFQRFGVHLGLTRIKNLLANLGNPQSIVPIIHVTGTNGKGSVCAYLSAVLTEAGYRVGRYTSPHLVDWTERICLNEQPITTTRLKEALETTIQAIAPDTETPTQFEVITAAAWLYFAQEKVDVAVIEVGLGGRLDATNVCDRPLASIITSISREHWQQLGSTLTAIATEKAGILKTGCPAILGQLTAEAEAVVKSRLVELNCPAVWVKAAKPLELEKSWAIYEDITYPLPLLGEIQLLNSAIAIATFKILQQQGFQITPSQIQEGMAKTKWLGRIQWVNWHNYRLLIDGAHNPAAAIALRNYVDTLKTPITWVMGMLSTKDHEQILTALLRPGDELYLVPVRDHSTADPETLQKLGLAICPQLRDCRTFGDLFNALEESLTKTEGLTVLCGSLYLVGYFLSVSTTNR
ncbi:MAG: bifunctional folylpolyglutamate synthase/dihydrofolate synthase [Gloeocapsa sp. DLM2.Bin57]|nr:MAG: bifunctional folylpolyglutamate synthase/dihydrofolate synthase [Gloeocapsa sp. DLM2.Bin57]